MKRAISLLCAVTAAPLSAIADDTVFAEGVSSPFESFGSVEGAVYFAGAVSALVVIFALLAWGRSVHRKATAELGEIERLLSEVDR